jgi:competence protein ComEA
MAGVREYFSFSKRERTGAVILIIVIGIVFLLPEFVPAPKRKVDANSVAEIRKQMDALQKTEPDSVTGIPSIGIHEDQLESSKSTYEFNPKPALFYFDPNTLTENGWKKLGVSPRAIQTIQNYISKGGQFRKPEDISRIYGLRKEMYERLLPYVRINTPSYEKGSNDKRYAGSQTTRGITIHTPAIIDINQADTSALIALPGIGSRLANRILHFRERLGGFYSVEQVKETYGLADSTFQKIKPFLKCSNNSIQQININTADESVLKQHPYIRWNIAHTIVSYRQQHGNYAAIEDILKIDIVSSEIFQKLAPYIRVN